MADGEARTSRDTETSIGNAAASTRASYIDLANLARPATAVAEKPISAREKISEKILYKANLCIKDHCVGASTADRPNGKVFRNADRISGSMPSSRRGITSPAPTANRGTGKIWWSAEAAIIT